jgi:tetratricopeptide (TPR) repeat protein
MSDPALHRHLFDAVEAGYPALAVELARACLAREAETFAVLMHYGMALQELARYDEAHAALARAESLADGSERVLLLRQQGSLAEARGDHDGAAALYERAIALAPEDPTGYIYLGTMRWRRGRLDDAVRALRRAVTCTDGPLDEAWCNLGLVLRSRGDYLEALECFRAALALDPDYPAALEASADVERLLFDFPLG